MRHPDYRNYSVDDLTRDEYFRQWVIDRDSQSGAFWSEWLAENPDCTDKVQVARAFLQALEEKNTALQPAELDQIFNDILHSSQRQEIPFWRTTVFRIAAALLLFIGLGYVSYSFLTKSRAGQPVGSRMASLDDLSPALTSDYTETVNESAEPRTFLLHDSSTVVLYPNGRLRYPNHFAATKREVYLSGRAFFSVKKNPKMPFWVYTDQISTQVLGTSFLITTGETDAKVEVRSGRVSVYMRKDVVKEETTRNNELVGMVLTPNQQVVFSTTEKRLVKSVVEQPITLHPVRQDAYVFEETPVTDVFSLLEKTYGLTFIYDASNLKECYLTANLAGESLFEKLNLICKITRSSYEMVDGQIVIHSKGCENK
ncbi:FecR family protein [Larkinella knui]|uniref:FecR family protein n=1 Tax=Larkinella knui TaxID=2025310 RepID=A0A3P1CYM2_9BACT|nr:FecR family protein [Larkinella knui]RRB17974.1 FecR family protein [Larkinella knui]